LVPSGDATTTRVDDFRCDPHQPPGTPDQPCDIPSEENYRTGGWGVIWGLQDHGRSYRNQIRADVTIYPNHNEAKFGGDYQDGRAQARSCFPGGQAVRRFDDFGQTYYQHRFWAPSPHDLTPVDWPTQARVSDYGAYVQDSWRVAPNLTINAGLRLD